MHSVIAICKCMLFISEEVVVTFGFRKVCYSEYTMPSQDTHSVLMKSDVKNQQTYVIQCIYSIGLPEHNELVGWTLPLTWTNNVLPDKTILL